MYYCTKLLQKKINKNKLTRYSNGENICDANINNKIIDMFSKHFLDF